MKINKYLILLLLVGIAGCELDLEKPQSNEEDRLTSDDSTILLVLSTSSNEIFTGESVNISWQSTNAESCIASGNWQGTKPIQGEETVVPQQQNNIFSLECFKGEESILRNISVTTKAIPNPLDTTTPELVFSSASVQVEQGQSVLLDWKATDSSTCIASGAWSGTKLLEGSELTTPLLNDSEFYLTCSSESKEITKIINVAVKAPEAPALPELILSSDSVLVEQGQSVLLDWKATSSSTCIASGAWSGEKSLGGRERSAPIMGDSEFSLTCSNGSNETKKTINVTVKAPETPVLPELIFSSDSVLIEHGLSVLLDWKATNVSNCIASSAWSGVKLLEGNERTAPILNDSEFVLTCSEGSNEIVKTIYVSVFAPLQPELKLSSNLNSVNSGDEIELSWTGKNVDSCEASDNWSGVKNIEGTETIGPVLNDLTLTLTCSKDAAGISKSLVINVLPAPETDAGISGSIDSSYVSRLGINKVYLYQGNVIPDDIDGDSGDPFVTIDIAQQPGSCDYSYQLDQLPEGDYTFALTSEAEKDSELTDDVLDLREVHHFTHENISQIHNVVANTIHRVGPSRSLKTVFEASQIVEAGDVIEIDAGLYTDDIVVWRTNDLTIRGVGGLAHIKGTYRIPYNGTDRDNGMGLWVIKAHRITIENIEFSGASVDDLNGAGIRNQGRDLTVCGSYFHDNENGFLGGANGTLIFENSEFSHNGSGDGRTHNMYIGGGEKFILRHSYSHHAYIGHNVKTRAKENHVLYNRIMGEADGRDSYSIDVPNGGLTYIIGNTIQQSPSTDNSTMVSYGAEGLSSDGRVHKTYIVNNTLVNDLNNGSIFYINNGLIESNIINNLYVGGGSVNGIGNLQNNLKTSTPNFQNRTAYNYRLLQDSPAINGGINPGAGDGFSLTPISEYLHPASRKVRPIDDILDIGAFEYTNP